MRQQYAHSSMARLYRDELRGYLTRITELAERAEALGFGQLALEILDFGVEIEWNTAPIDRSRKFYARINDLDSELYTLNQGWHRYTNGTSLVTPSDFEAKYRSLESCLCGLVMLTHGTI